MLYVFLVDTGAMLTFQMELAMESVETLMKTITSMFMIPIEKQVLIMQGGEALDPSHRICNYSSAGTESNPIFLFSKSTIESLVPPSPSLNLGSETSLKEEVELSLKLPPTYETLVSRANLALRFQDMASELLQSCVSLVSEQHLQRQGWFSVIANLENIAGTFQTRGTLLEQNYAEFLEIIPQYKSLLDSFRNIMVLLSKIPVFPCLINNDMKTFLSKNKDVTLLDWINAQDTKNSLEDMVQQCVEALEQFQKASLLEIKTDRDQVLEDVSNKNMKEIGGLEERLDLLSRICEKAHTLAQEQSDMAQGFSQNQVRAQNIGDPSVLPDLCASHRKQLSLLMHNHSQLRDTRRRCAKAKDELSVNLHARLRWVMMIEKRICDCDNKLVLYHESMKRIRKRVEILEQINLAPRIYALTVKEVVRRRDFTSQFMKWTKSIAHVSQGIYKEEVTRRHEFSQVVGHHFLQNLFTGIDDMPTPFATTPELFDVDLPAITPQDLEELMVQVPDLFTAQTKTDDVQTCVTDKETIPIFMKVKSVSCEDLPIVKQFVMESSVDGMETSLSRVEKSTSRNKETEDQTYKSQEDEDEESRLKSADILTLKSKEIDGQNAVTEVSSSRTKNLSDDKSTEPQLNSKIILFPVVMKEDMIVNLNKIRNELQQLTLATKSWKKSVNEYLSDRMRRFEEFKVSVKLTEDTKRFGGENVVEVLTEKLKILTKKMGSLGAENESLRKELKAKEDTFSEDVLRYRTELKRQKQLASAMESAKEKFEAEQQIRFNSAISRLMMEKEVALKKASVQLTELKNLQVKNEEKLQVLFNEKEELHNEKQEMAKKLAAAFDEFESTKRVLESCVKEAEDKLEEKEKLYAEHLENEKKEAAMLVETGKQKWETDSSGSGQIISELVVERFHKRIKHLEEENDLLKDRLKSGTDGEDKILFVELQQSLDEKSKECDSLKAELELLQKKPRSSQVVFKDFQKGDIVEVYYNDRFGLYMIRTIGDTLYFVHPESLVNLDLPPEQLKLSATIQAQILDKEYCQAKKANNRFKVAVGTKFYRVKVRSWIPST